MATLELEFSQLTVLYDDECEVCRSIQRNLEKRRSVVVVNWVSMHSDESIQRFPHLRIVGGDLFSIVDDKHKVYFETDARLLLLSTYPEYWLVSKTLGLPLLRRLTDVIFSFVASNRGFLSSILFSSRARSSDYPLDNCSLKNQR